MVRQGQPARKVQQGQPDHKAQQAPAVVARPVRPVPRGRKARSDPQDQLAQTGAPGISNYSTHTNNSGNRDSVRFKEVQVNCPAGTRALGGGGEISPSDNEGVGIVSTFARGNGWFVKAETFVGSPSWKLITHVVLRDGRGLRYQVWGAAALICPGVWACVVG